MINGAPQIDIPLHLQEPSSCRRCAHHGTYRPGTGVERSICLRTPQHTSCAFERGIADDPAVCAPQARFFKESTAL